jgi:hypothetical protein
MISEIIMPATTVHKVHLGEIEGSQDSETATREEHRHELSPARHYV